MRLGRKLWVLALVALPVGAVAVMPLALASSHREAPIIADDPAADPTDFYMFRSPTEDKEAANTVTFIANFWPLEEPGGGPNFPRLSHEVVYDIKIDNNGDAKDDVAGVTKRINGGDNGLAHRKELLNKASGLLTMLDLGRPMNA